MIEPGTRVMADMPDGTHQQGRVQAITPRGHRIELQDGRTRTLAWWRLRRLCAHDGCDRMPEPGHEHCTQHW